MIRFTLRLEAIGDDTATAIREVARRAPKDLKNFIKFKERRPWVAEITGTCEKYGLQRKFLEGQIDCLESNGPGSRGLAFFYFLKPGRLYEVNQLLTWSSERRFFIVTMHGEEEPQELDRKAAMFIAEQGGRL